MQHYLLLESKKLLDLWFVTIHQRIVMLFEFHIYDFRGSYIIEFLYIFVYIEYHIIDFSALLYVKGESTIL